MQNDFKIFEDKDLKVEIKKELDLGKLKIGDTKQYTYYLYNSVVDPYEQIKLSTNRKELKVILAPTELAEKTSAKIILEFKPILSTKLKVKPTLEIKGFRVEPL